eukprot:m.204413 g.204413  ORF g.204413 m.204413 type:complete len:686 (+) comp15389_c0_seq1:177-2234(+)
MITQNRDADKETPLSPSSRTKTWGRKTLNRETDRDGTLSPSSKTKTMGRKSIVPGEASPASKSMTLGGMTLGRSRRRSEVMAITEFTDVRPEGLTRMEVNQLMTRELRLRDGCKNMLRLINKDAKHIAQRTEIKAQLASIHKNVTRLHAELQKINMQTALTCRCESLEISPFPMIALALKETVQADDLEENLNEFIESHYHEPREKLEKPIETLCAARESARLAGAHDGLAGIKAIQNYFWHLQRAEHRFFQEDRCRNAVFQWYDAFEGHPITKKSLKLEKASMLYNFAALSTQIACKADRNTSAGLEEAIQHLQSAAGTLQYIREESSLKTSVSTDLSRSSLSTLSTLMLAQAQECIWYLSQKNGRAANKDWQPDGGEAAAVAGWYSSVRESLRQPLASSMPKTWIDMVCFKEVYYRGIADWYVGVLEMAAGDRAKKISGVAKVYRASIVLKGCLGKWRKTMENDPEFADLIEDHLGLTQQVLENLDKSIVESITDKLDRIPAVTGKAMRWATARPDAIINHDHPDLFAALGPVYFFNAMCALVERRSHHLTHTEETGFGITLSGGNPVRVSDVAYNGSAADTGVMCGDYVIEVDGVDVRGQVAHEVEAIFNKAAATTKEVSIVVVVNYDMQNFEELINPEMPTAAAERVDTLSMPSQWHRMPGAGVAFNLAGKSPFKLDLVEA